MRTSFSIAFEFGLTMRVGFIVAVECCRASTHEDAFLQTHDKTWIATAVTALST